MAWFEKSPVVVPIDFHERSQEAVDVAIDTVLDPSEINVVYAAPDFYMTEPWMDLEKVSSESRKLHMQREFQKRFEDPKYKDIHFHVAFGSPGECIIDYAKEIDAQLIIMPSHGRTGLDHLLIGSVAERVVRLAHCPVLVLRS